MAMPPSQLRLEQLDHVLDEAVRDVCSVMLNWRIEPGIAEGAGRAGAFRLQNFNGCVGFAGHVTGTLFFSCSESLARRMAAIILGGNQADELERISDVLGELTSMLAGGCKSRLADQDCPTVISIPNIIRGNNLRAASMNVEFILQRQFAPPIPGETFRVIALGQFN